METDREELLTTLLVCVNVAVETINELLPNSPERDLALQHLDATVRLLGLGCRKKWGLPFPAPTDQ